MEPQSCSILPSVKVKWNGQKKKKDKQLVGDRKSQFLHLFPSSPVFMLHWVFLLFSLLPPFLLYQAGGQCEGCSVQDEGELSMVAAPEGIFS